MKHYNPIIFDWDGCLAMTLEVWMESLRDAYAHFGAHPTDAEIGFHFGDWNSAQYFGIEDQDAFDDYIIANAYPKLETVALYPGVRDMLVRLKADGRHLVLFSSSQEVLIEKGLAHNKLEHIFNLVITGDDVANHKPDPEGIFYALKRTQGTKAGAVMIGDSRKDLGAATAAGIDSILTHHEGHDLFYDIEMLRSYAPTHEVRTIAELDKLLG